MSSQDTSSITDVDSIMDAAESASTASSIESPAPTPKVGKKRPAEVLDDTGSPSIEDLAEAMKSLPFLRSHPQFMSHHINMAPDDHDVALELDGGVLPRKDAGNLEEYCMTMLTFFKPWRSPLDLKHPEETWKTAFENYEWPERAVTAMRNMHIKYECNDARDDYNAQMRKNQHKLTTDAESYLDLRESGWDEEDEMNRIMAMLTTEERLEAMRGQAGKSWTMDQSKMSDTKSSLLNIGWMDRVTDDIADGSGTQSLSPVDGRGKTRAQWKAALQAAKHEILSKRQKQVAEALRNGKIREIRPEHIDSVTEVDESYLTSGFAAGSPEAKQNINEIVQEFTLNEEQERAFRIVAQHASYPSGKQLRMYLGGMAGTGKSQVIKALMHFFEQREESYAFVVVAPTAAAATLVAGSTYHSLLGFAGSRPSQTVKSLQKVREKLQHVSYLFIDEISMIECLQLYNISAQMCLSLDVSELAFGGKNMMMSGDFAQLPPSTNGLPLYSHSVGSVLHTANSVYLQQATMGKALWHTFTTVVILTQNMRQRGASAEDNYFRTILNDLRFGACTDDQVDWLNRRVAGRAPGQPRMSDPATKFASIITSWNASRDQINDMGATEFARCHGKTVKTFYSVDKWTSREPDNNGGLKKRNNSTIDVLRDSDDIDKQMQDVLWEVHPSRSDQHAGKLELCLGIPVLIKYNEATEAGVTNGAEGFVVGWNSRPIGDGKETLDTLFVKLKVTASPIKVHGLPDNVVPVAAYTKYVGVKLHDDSALKVSRTQVPVLLNFSMTDYASQGRSRPQNPMDPSDCKSIQSLYTCLSRATTWESNVLVSPISKVLAQSALSQQLRREFQQLELLNAITKLRFEGRLPDQVQGETRTSLINSFQQWKGVDWCPPNIHPAIRWSKSDPIGLTRVEKSTPWVLIKPNNKGVPSPAKGDNHAVTEYVVAKGSISLKDTSSTPMRKRQAAMRADRMARPTGLRWDSETLSCAYDSLLTILHLTYATQHPMWTTRVTGLNQYTDAVSQDWANYPDELERSRESLQRMAHEEDPNHFPIDGTRGTSVADLCDLLFSTEVGSIVRIQSCIRCGRRYGQHDISSLLLAVDHDAPNATTSTAGIVRQWLDRTVKSCNCGGLIKSRVTTAGDPPPILAVDVNAKISVTSTMSVDFGGRKESYMLAGVIYFGDEHFTSRLFDRQKNVWKSTLR